MAHFAKIGLNNKVIQVVVVNDSDCLNADGIEDETVGQIFLERSSNWPAQLWVQASYNTKNGQYWVTTNESTTLAEDQSKAFRGNFPSPGYMWDEDSNTFWPPKPNASWVKNHTTKEWDAPISHPLVINEGSGESLVSYDIYWDEDAYQANNTKGWKMTKSNDTSDPKTVYDWNGSSWTEE